VNAKDRRQNPRLSIDVEVDFASGHNFYSARTRDISAGGLFIETSAVVPIGTELMVELKFLKKHLRVAGEVMWALSDGDRPVGVGLRFVDLQPAAKKSIESFMALRKPMEGGDLIEEDGEAPAAQPPPLPRSPVPRPGSAGPSSAK
jgi:uncharacterized protein (TIGR02266 family)